MIYFADISSFEQLGRFMELPVSNQQPSFSSEIRSFLGFCKQCDEKIAKLSGNGVMGGNVLVPAQLIALKHNVQNLETAFLDLSAKWDVVDASDEASEKVSRLLREAKDHLSKLKKNCNKLERASAKKWDSHRGVSTANPAQPSVDTRQGLKQLWGKSVKAAQQVYNDYAELRKIRYVAQSYLNTCAALGFKTLTNSQLQLYQTLLDSCEKRPKVDIDSFYRGL